MSSATGATAPRATTDERAGTAADADAADTGGAGAAEGPDATAGRARGGGARRLRPPPAGALLLVAIAVTPIVLGAVAVMGEPWFPIGDWASLAWRTGQVGTVDTPLIGAYSTKGGSHPGPLHYWLGAPLLRLMGGDPRSLMLTAAALNVACVAGLAAVAWRRGRWPLLLTVVAVSALVVNGFGAEMLVDLWNPFPPLLPFLLGTVLVWDAALGRRRAIAEATAVLTFAVQCHLPFLPLVAVLVVWAVAWVRWSPRLLGADDGPAGSGAPVEADDRSPEAGTTGEGRDRRRGWRSGLVPAAVVGAALWFAPLVDALFVQNNPWRVISGFGKEGAVRLAPVDAVGLVGRHVRPDGPWLGGAEPTDGIGAAGSGPVPLVLALAVLAGCVVVARRRRLVDAAALSSLAFVLALGAVPAATQLVLPAELYVTQWLKVVGAVVWLAVAWTVWRLVAPAVLAVPARRVAAVGLAGAVVVGGCAAAWGEASGHEAPFREEGEIVRALGPRLDEAFAGFGDDEVIRVERRGEPWHVFGPGVIGWLLENDHDIVTGDGGGGLKWGETNRWGRGDPYDRLLTVAVHDAGSFTDAFAECEAFPGSRLLASYEGLDDAERAWLDDARLRRLADPASLSDEEVRRAADLESRNLRIGLFEADEICAADRRLQPE